MFYHFADRLTAGFSGVEHAGAIHVNLEAESVGFVADLVDHRQRIDASACHVMRVFNFDDCGAGAMGSGWLDELSDFRPREDSVFSGHGAEEHAGEPGNHGEFPIHEMRAGIADYFLTVMGVQLDGDGVAHGARGNKQRRLFASDFGSSLFEAIDGWVFAINVVSHFGFRHGSAHGCGGLSHCVTTQINHAVKNS